MRRREKFTLTIMFISFTLVLALFTLAGCRAAPIATTQTTMDSSTVLTIVKNTQINNYTMASLKGLASITGWGTYGTGPKMVGPNQYRGITLSDLLSLVGGITQDNAVVLTGSDNYTRTVSFSQIMNGDFTTFDNGQAAAQEITPKIIVAYEKDGAPLDDTTGPLAISILTAKNKTTQGSWWVRHLIKIEVLPVQ
jgi:hypothetical protein